MTAATIVLVGLTAGTYGLKAAAPMVLGDRPLPTWVNHLSVLLPAALLAALVAVSAASDESSLTLDARLLGLGAAAVALRFRAPFVVVVVAAAATTAITRLAT